MNFDKAADFIWRNGRLLERRIFEYSFYNGSANSILEALRAYQNSDGGFGNALEPDLRAPDSQPLFIEFAMRILYECHIRDSEIACNVCDFISRHADLSQGIPTIFASSRIYPRAEHWGNPSSEQPSFNRLTGLVGLIAWQGIQHPWLNSAIEVCLKNIATESYDDSHTILNVFCLLESIPQTGQVEELYKKLSNELFKANFFCYEAASRQYGLTPLEFSPTPASYCRRIFSDAVIDNHLNELASQQLVDGGWQIKWEPPGEMAKLEWRGYKTLKALITLKAYNMI